MTCLDLNHSLSHLDRLFLERCARDIMDNELKPHFQVSQRQQKKHTANNFIIVPERIGPIWALLLYYSSHTLKAARGRSVTSTWILPSHGKLLRYYDKAIIGLRPAGAEGLQAQEI